MEKGVIASVTAVVVLLGACVGLMKGCHELKEVVEARPKLEGTKDPPKMGKAADPNKKGPPPGLEVDAVDPALKTIKVGRELDSWDPAITIRLENIVFQERKMRWNFSLWNKTGKQQFCQWCQQGTYVVDQNGKRREPIGNSTNLGPNLQGFSLPNGQKLDFWIDFQPPLQDARTLTATFGGHPGKTLPETSVDIP